MTLYDRLPDGVTVDGRFYRLDFDFRNVLRMMEELDRDDVMPGAREYNALKCLCKHPRNVSKVLTAVRQLLFPVAPKGEKTQKITDYKQDAAMIRAAFLQSYGINLYREKLHWLEFSELLQNIPEGSRYTEIVGIRARPMPAPTKYNQAEREWLMKAKSQYALHVTEKEQEAQYSQDVAKVFNGLLNVMNRG